MQHEWKWKIEEWNIIFHGLSKIKFQGKIVKKKITIFLIKSISKY